MVVITSDFKMDEIKYFKYRLYRDTEHGLKRQKDWLKRLIKSHNGTTIERLSTTFTSNGHCESCRSLFITVMYRSNRSFNMPSPRAFDFFENYCSNSPLPGSKCRSNAPHYGPFRWSNAPTPGTFHRHKTARGTAETPSVVEQNLYKYNKTEKHC